MPELPEVETVARDLAGLIEGRRVTEVWVSQPGILRYPVADVFTTVLPGCLVGEVQRRGKFIVCHLDNDEDLIFHLGMTGHLRVVEPDVEVVKHTHLRAGLDNAMELRFDDARRFGRVLLGPRALLESSGVLAPLGVEPLSADFTGEHLDAWLRRTTRSVKTALLDQRGIAGLGNIYVDEACHLAGVRPTRLANRLTRAQRAALLQAIPAVLVKAIGNRGTTFDDYRDVWNAKGSNQEALQVYGRGGQPCFRCGALLRKTVVGGRTTVYCAGCQK
ncbi:MAG: bifunctional DNA-formamidopyrimidine glycosylase/DNA-(apurinic or apyrimidinic site) lyase [Candidatus Dormibacteria bacterium]